GTGNALYTTARLWGVSDSGPYLHDGRALTLSDAISQHGGEAQANADAFDSLAEVDRAALIAYLDTLHTPALPSWRLNKGRGRLGVIGKRWIGR
ncbi:MAG: hypothetical protein JRH17_22910, partial [Deltaproteobacteria bacterium]|nr:hypothetical protein [Deltaproteobacteria bacterium]